MLTAKMKFFVLALLLTFTYNAVDAFHLMASAGQAGQCHIHGVYGIIKTLKSDCDVMGGLVNGAPLPNNWVNCHLDWCIVPYAGATSTGAIWGIDPSQDSPTTDSNRINAIVRLKRKDCGNLRGRITGNPQAEEWTDCQLYFLKTDGLGKPGTVKTPVFSSVGGCAIKLGYGIIRTIHKECFAINGKWNGNPTSEEWIDCHLDICAAAGLA